MATNTNNTQKSAGKALPNTFVLEITQRCNNNCLYCYNVWRSPGSTYPKGEMSSEEIKNIIMRLQDEVPLQSIAFSGGEPFLRSDLPALVSFARERGISSTIITNGTLLTDENVAATIETNSYEIPLLSFRSETHNRLVQRDVFDSVIEGIVNIHRRRGTFVAVFVATKMNYDHLYETVRLAIALGAVGLMYNRMNLSAHNMQYIDELLPTPSMIEENLDALKRIVDEFKLPISCSVPIQPCLVDINRYDSIYYGWCPLGGKNAYYTIDSLGNLRVCNHSAVILGDLKTQSFKELANMPYVNEWQDTIPSECANCNHELKSLCQGGCKAAAEVCYNTLKTVDPYVKLNRKS